jgi:CelD/BcsL family acetyltransferase involved in cellulose biosynthesis
MLSLQVRVCENLDQLAALVPPWEDLLAHFPGATIFSTWEWLAPWWRAYADGQRLCAAAFFESPSKLIGLAPFVLGARRLPGGFRFRILKLLGDGSGDSDNLDMPVRAGHEDAFAAALVEWLQHQAPAWDVCELNSLPANSAAAESLRKEPKLRTWNTFCGQQPCSVVHLPHSWEEYRNGLSSEHRHNLDRYRRRLERRYRVRFYKCTEQRELHGRLEALFRLHRERWRLRGETGTFECEARRRFYRAISESLLARGRLEFWFLDLNGEPAAAQFAMRYGDSVFQLQEGFDPKHRSDRVGFLLRGHVLQQLIGEGVRRYDFLAGQALHKSRWGAEPANYLSIRLARKSSAAAVYLRCAHHSSDVKEQLRAHLSQKAWRILHWVHYHLNGMRLKSRHLSGASDSSTKLPFRSFT